MTQAQAPSNRSGADPSSPWPGGGELATKYRPSEHEDRIREMWDRSGAFHADPQRVLSGEKPPYCIVIPPPNVTARLHLGHALNNSLQDVLVRMHRMKGYETLWMPGTDHAGIATQTVVEQRILKEEGKRRTDFTRDDFVARVQAWKDEYEAEISDQLKQMGCSCDWARQRFTMDEICARAVREAFFRLFKAGLIYRGKRLVNWDPVTQTALADDEVEMEEIDGKFYYLRYPLVENGQPVTWSELSARGYPGADQHPSEEPAWLTVATTRPETYLGDTAVAVNPSDPRAAALEGLHVNLPLVGRIIPIVQDDYVVRPDPESSDPKAQYATGFLKVTPAHDPNDWDIGQRHDLPVINVMAPDASISDQHGWSDVGDAHLFVGMTREDAREKVVAEFKARGLLEEMKPYRHSVGHSYRSHAAIEPYLSDQWYCKVTDDRLRGFAQRALPEDQRASGDWRAQEGIDGDGAMRFFPARYAQMYESWHDNLRDWCISRQLWWGHRIPVWSINRHKLKQPHKDILQTLAKEFAAWVEHRGRLSDDPEEPSQREYWCLLTQIPEVVESLEAAGFERDPDVLDTWFSSALWPMSTMGWPEPEQSEQTAGVLEAFNPTSVLSTAREIITLWVSRMAMFNRYFLPPSPANPEQARGAGGEGLEKSDDSIPGPVPFHHVYIHPVVQDGHGQRMSKSLGNGVDPLDIVHSHGADAMRFVLCQMTTTTQDVRLPVDLVCPHCEHIFEASAIKAEDSGKMVAAPEQTCPSCGKAMISAYGVNKGHAPREDAPAARNTSSKFDSGRNFCTKLWNATRFAMMKLDGAQMSDTSAQDLSLVDRWMLARLALAIGKIDQSMSEYRFSEYAQSVYELVWWDFCDWYLEAIKPTVERSKTQQAVLRNVLDAILRLLHPITPFVTEVLFEKLRTISAGSIEGLTLGSCDMLCTAGWPEASAALADDDAEAEFARLQAIVTAIRETRASHKVPPKRKVTLHADQATVDSITSWGGIVEALAGLESATTDSAPGGSVVFLFDAREFALSGLADAVDVGAERARLEEQIAKLDKDIAALDKRLSNPGYVNKAPAHLVEETKGQLAQKQAEREAAASRLGELG